MDRLDRFFDSDNPVMKFLATLVDLAVVNVLTVLFALPLITAGAAFTAMNYVMFHLQKGDETYVTRMFWKSFKSNLKQGIPESLIMIVMAVVTVCDLWILHGMDSRLFTMMMVIITVVAAYVFVLFVYLFALQARYENTVRGAIANAFRLSIGNLPRTVGMMIIWCLWIVALVFLQDKASLAFLLFGYSLPGFLCTILYEPVFNRLEEDNEEDQQGA